MRVRWHFRKVLKSLLVLAVVATLLLFQHYYDGSDVDAIQGRIFRSPLFTDLTKNSSVKILGIRPSFEFNRTTSATKHTLVRNEDVSINPSFGEALAKALNQKCETRPKTGKKFIQAVTSSKDYNIMLCPMCKLASTFWTRFFKMLEVYNEPQIETPYDIAISAAPPTRERITFQNGILNPRFYRSQYKFLFVRNPYARVLSAYVDKLFAPNPTFWKGVATTIIRVQRQAFPLRSRLHIQAPFSLKTCGSDLKFEEYVRAIVNRHRAKRDGSVDCHDAEFHSSCHTCDIQYDFVGKMEHFLDDSVFLYKKLGLNKTINSIQKFPSLLEHDALYDTVTSAFAFKNEVIKCITWDEALRRVWRKLQIRGVIGKEPFPLPADESNKIDVEEFIWLVKETRLKSSNSERRKQRKEALIEIYRSVPIDLLNQLKSVYSTDFELFNYDTSPDYIFNRTKDIIPFGYLSV